ncbi:MBL fold metallo-hydrolase [Alkalihalobacillus sp. MEB203]|uniref:MBL fold metallo-hydrolase n=2 Tax=Alkalihalobacterium chitinilyticum TaxID=2980103 RepID=A0ABT5VDB2_9BACI|nr:MBL fold metallo-hydrolase [Alkalihalobacterium chitinilyticum]MDE5413450.1 MBL fold metallo-hydrolase [Alkalihalobacterium chitinilyticum]
MEQQPMTYGTDYKPIPAISATSGQGLEILPDLYSYNVRIVNICLVGHRYADNFVLVDAGMPGSADEIIAATEERFGANSCPKAIFLTHGHFDHVGSIMELVKHWKVPVYAYPLELPFLTGKQSYPDPDPTVEGGMIAKMSSFFPNEPINLGKHVQPLPSNGTVPEMEGFCWVHTPGHTPGHVSYFRDEDGALIAGDAFVTVKQESLYAVLTQEKEISGPPRYFTPDWKSAWESVKKLEALKPSLAITGHGLPMIGEELSKNLKTLADDFGRIAVPDYGKYVGQHHKH